MRPLTAALLTVLVLATAVHALVENWAAAAASLSAVFVAFALHREQTA